MYSLEEAPVIGTKGVLYKLKVHSEEALIPDTTSPCELLHRSISHIKYKAPPHVRKVVTSIPNINIDHEGICKGCAKGKNIKDPFPKRENKPKEILEHIRLDVYSSIPSTSLSGYMYIM